MTAPSTSLKRIALAAILGLCPVPAAQADAWKVALDGSGDFTQISDAVAWATDGDVIYVLEGAYGPVAVHAKGLSIVADELAEVVVEEVLVKDLGPGQHVALSGLKAVRTGQTNDSEAGLRFENCRGSIRVQGCDVTWSTLAQGSHRGGGASFIDCDDVALKDCDLRGGSNTSSGGSNPGQFGLLAERSKVSAFDCSVRGPSWSGNGLECRDARLLLSNCFVRGGPGRSDENCSFGGPGGTGLVGTGESTVHLQGTRVLGGPGGISAGFFCWDVGPPGARYELEATVVMNESGAIERSWSSDFVEEPGGPFRIRYEGLPGDRLHVLRSAVPAHDVQFPAPGVELLVPGSDQIFIGVADESGLLEVVQTPAAPMFTDPNAGFFLQAVVEAADQSTHLLSHGHLAMIPTGMAEDCGRIVHVHPGGTPGASGATWADAVPTLTEAIDRSRIPNLHCGAGSEIWVAGGTYTAAPGSSSSQTAFHVDFPVTLRGGFAGDELSPDERVPGTNETLISGDLLGNDLPDFVNYEDNSRFLLAFDLDQDHGTVVVDRLTLRGSSFGRAMYVQGAERVFVSELDVDRHRGSSNAPILTLQNTGAHGPLLEVELQRCRFTDNFASGSAPGCRIEADTIRVTHCEFVGNSSINSNSGNAMLLVANNELDGVASVEGCLFRRNVLMDGCALRVDSGETRVRGCAFVGNRSMTGPSGIFLIGSRTRVENCVLWGNRSEEFPGPAREAQLGVSTSPYVTSSFGLASSCIEGLDNAWPNVNCFSADPLLDAGGRPQPGSPCLDAGDNALVPADALDLDGDGDLLEPLPIDLDGAPRFVDDPAAPDVGQGTSPLVDVGPFERQP